MDGRRRLSVVPFGELIDENVLPAVVRVAAVRRDSSGRIAHSNNDHVIGSQNEASYRKQQPQRQLMYVHWRQTTSTVVIGHGLRQIRHDKVDIGGLVPTGRTYSVALDHRGWFELLSADGHSSAPVNSVAKLLELGVERFLVGEPTKVEMLSASNEQQAGAYPYQHAATTDEHLICSGETLTLLGVVPDAGLHQKTLLPSSSVRYQQLPGCRVQCVIDRTGDVVALTPAQHGTFLPVAIPNAVAGVHHIRSIVGKFRLPVVARLVGTGNDANATMLSIDDTITVGSVVRLTEIRVEKSVLVVPLGLPPPETARRSSVGLLSQSPNVFIIPKRAALVVDRKLVPESDVDANEIVSVDSVSETNSSLMDQLGQRCESLIGNRAYGGGSGKYSPPGGHSGSIISVACSIIPIDLSSSSKSSMTRVGRGLTESMPDLLLAGNERLPGRHSLSANISDMRQAVTCPLDIIEHELDNRPMKAYYGSDVEELKLMAEIDDIYDAIKDGRPPGTIRRQHIINNVDRRRNRNVPPNGHVTAFRQHRTNARMINTTATSPVNVNNVIPDQPGMFVDVRPNAVGTGRRRDGQPFLLRLPLGRRPSSSTPRTMVVSPVSNQHFRSKIHVQNEDESRDPTYEKIPLSRLDANIESKNNNDATFAGFEPPTLQKFAEQLRQTAAADRQRNSHALPNKLQLQQVPIGRPLPSPPRDFNGGAEFDHVTSADRTNVLAGTAVHDSGRRYVSSIKHSPSAAAAAAVAMHPTGHVTHAPQNSVTGGYLAGSAGGGLYRRSTAAAQLRPRSFAGTATSRLDESFEKFDRRHRHQSAVDDYERRFADLTSSGQRQDQKPLQRIQLDRRQSSNSAVRSFPLDRQHIVSSSSAVWNSTDVSGTDRASGDTGDANKKSTQTTFGGTLSAISRSFANTMRRVGGKNRLVLNSAQKLDMHQEDAELECRPPRDQIGRYSSTTATWLRSAADARLSRPTAADKRWSFAEPRTQYNDENWQFAAERL